MPELLEAIVALRAYFSGGQLIAMLVLWASIHYVLKPTKGFLSGLKRLLEVPTVETQKGPLSPVASLMDRLETFLVAQIEAKHEEVFVARNSEKALKSISEALQRAYPAKK